MDSVWLKVEHKIGAWELGEYVNEHLAKGVAVVIHPAEDYDPTPKPPQIHDVTRKKV